MKPQLLQVNEQFNDLVDYTQGAIIRYFKAGISKYYFTLHPEHYQEGEVLEPTGRFFAVMLTPKGIKAFYVVQDAFGNYIIDYDVDNEDSPAQKLSKLRGFTTDFANALQHEIMQRVHELQDYMNMINVALKEHLGILVRQTA